MTDERKMMRDEVIDMEENAVAATAFHFGVHWNE